MKRVSFLIVALALCSSPAVRAQDAATQERLQQLSGRIDDLTASQEVLKKEIGGLTRELANVREQLAKPTANYVRPEDLKGLAKAIEEVDRKRMEDAEKVHAEFLKLRTLLDKPLPPTKKKGTTVPKDEPAGANPTTSGKFFEYKVKSGDTLDIIAQAYREQNVKVTVSQIVKANPGLKPERLRVGQTIYIPAPQP